MTRLKIDINLYNWFDVPPDITGLCDFYNITSHDPSTPEFDRLTINYDENDQEVTFKIYLNNVLVGTYVNEEILEIGRGITLDCLINNTVLDNIIYLMTEWVGIDIDGLTSMICYLQNCDNDELNKTLTPITIIQGKFKSVLALKSLAIDVQDYDFGYNYIYINAIHRYYYVDSVEMVTKDLKRLHLREDVLMSWATLIRAQNAFITRYENSDEDFLVDVRRPVEDKLTVEYIIPTATATGSFKNTTLKTNVESNHFKIMVDTIVAEYGAVQNDYSAPSGLSLPSFTSLRSNNEFVQFIAMEQLQYLTNALVKQDSFRGFVNSIVLLPFDAYDAYHTIDATNGIRTSILQANEHVLCDDGLFHKPNAIPSGVYQVVCKDTTLSASPYFIIADFTLNAVNNNYLDYEPYTTWEIYVPFVSWVKLSANEIVGKRLIVYYILDYKSGMGTAYIYNVTDQKLLWSSNCQFGIKLDLVTTNEQEITRQKQANELNMILGLMSSALSIGVGVATENPVAIAGGVLSAGKTIAGAVNSNMMLFERAQISFGTAEGVFHSPLDVCIRRSYHKPINITTNIYQRMQGKPYNQYTAMTTLTGYVEVGDILFDLKGYNIFQDEVTEIVSLLKNGVIM